MRRLLGIITFAATLSASSTALCDEVEACAVDAEQGHALRDGGRFVDALERLSRCARDVCPRVVRNDCRETLVALRAQAPRVIVRVRTPAGVDVVDAEVALDGTKLSPAEQANGKIVDTGPHVVGVWAGGRPADERSVMITATDRARTVDFVVDARPAQPALASPSDTPARAAPSRVDRSPAIAAGALGISFLASAAILGTWAVTEHRSLESSCGTGCFRPEAEVAHARAIVADSALAAGIVSLAVATVLWFTAAPSRPTAARVAPPGAGSLLHQQ